MRCCKELASWFCCCKLGENTGFVLGCWLTARFGVGIGARFIDVAAGTTGIWLNETAGGRTVAGAIVGF